jgi:hypothetical protein
MIPITTNYDRTLPHRGHVDVKDGKIIVKLTEPIHEKDLFEVFGTIGFRAISYEMRDDGIRYKEFEICEFSYCVVKPVEAPNMVAYAGLPPPLGAFGVLCVAAGLVLAALLTWGDL